jgi:hypothetical protein
MDLSFEMIKWEEEVEVKKREKSLELNESSPNNKRNLDPFLNQKITKP